MKQNIAVVAAMTAYYIFRGRVVTGNKRLSDVLNDRLTDYVDIEDVRIYNLKNPQKPLDTPKTLYLRKREIEVIAILEEHIADPSGRLYSYVERVKKPAIMYIHTYRVHGMMSLRSKRESKGPLIREGDIFIPMNQAEIMSATNPHIRIKTPVALVNVNTFEAFSFLEEQT